MPRRYEAIEKGCAHAEAFNLMWYTCKYCDHTEQYWNSRDGVTPFGTSCPSCGRPELYHDFSRRDMFAPNHKPHPGQRIWRDMTEADARKIAERNLEAYRAALSFGAKRQQLPTIEELVSAYLSQPGQPFAEVTE